MKSAKFTPPNSGRGAAAPAEAFATRADGGGFVHMDRPYLQINTAAGRKQLSVETSKWDALAAAIGRILRPAE